MLPRVKGVDYNTWMSILAHITERIPVVASDYGASGMAVTVLPSYPRDLTKLSKPSIIVQRIHATQSSVGIGGYLGQYMDDDGRLYDASGMVHDMIYQINVVGDNNMECSILTSLVSEGILNMARGYNDEPVPIELRDYIQDINNPVVVGTVGIIDDPNIIPMSANDTNDYLDIIRVSFRVVQPIINMKQGFIDLGKPIKWNQTIIL